MFWRIFSSFYKQNITIDGICPRFLHGSIGVGVIWDFLIISDHQRYTYKSSLLRKKRYLTNHICFCKTWFVHIRSGIFYPEIWTGDLFLSLCLPSPQKGLLWCEAVYQFSDMSQRTLYVMLLLQQTHRSWNAQDSSPLSIITSYWNPALVTCPNNFISHSTSLSYLGTLEITFL